MLQIQTNHIMKNMMAQFITTVQTELANYLKRRVWFSSTIKTPEMPTDQGPKLGFKATYPEGWEKRKTMTQKEKTEYFNKWASKL